MRAVITALLCLAAGAAWAAELKLYEHKNFEGRSIRLRGSDPNFANRGFNDVASSAIIDSGWWELCEGSNFRGCKTLGPGSYRSLASEGINDRISSVRPVPRPDGGRSGSAASRHQNEDDDDGDDFLSLLFGARRQAPAAAPPAGGGAIRWNAPAAPPAGTPNPAVVCARHIDRHLREANPGLVGHTVMTRYDGATGDGVLETTDGRSLPFSFVCGVADGQVANFTIQGRTP
ncbi:MAG: hypothetical protein OHK0024_05940 [Thalassobaculales bacterium]